MSLGTRRKQVKKYLNTGVGAFVTKNSQRSDLIFYHCHTMYVCVFYIISICIVYCIFTTRRHTIIKDLVLLYKKSYPTSNTFHTSLIKN